MNRQILIGSVVLVVLVLAGVVYLTWRSDAPEVVPAAIIGPERAEDARGVIADIEQARERTAAEGAAPQPGARAAGEVARAPAGTRTEGGAGAVAPAPQSETPAGATDLDSAFSRAQEFQRTGQLADAQLLYFYAARDGHAASAFELGEMNDPNHHSPATSLLAEPDAFQAYRWYSAAAEQRFPGADERLDELHEWAMTAAAAGDIEAEQLLLQWE